MRKGVSSSIKGASIIIILLFVIGLAYAGSVASTSSPSSTASQTSTSSTASTNMTENLQKLDSDISVTLTVKAYHAHQQKAYYDQNVSNDLILNNFNEMLGAFFARGSSASAITWSPPGTGGAAAGFDTSGGCGVATGSTCGAFFEIGTSGTAPARTDTALNSPYTPSGGDLAFPDTAENAVLTTSPTSATCVEGTTDYVDGISGAQVVTGTEGFQEVGLFLGVGYSYDLLVEPNQVMVMHDTYPTIDAVAGDSVTVSYQIDLANAGFNNNFCEFLALLFTGNMATASAVSGNFENTGGSNVGFYLWCSESSYTDIKDALSTGATCGSASTVGQVGLGTSTASLSSSAYKLGTMVGGYGAWTTDAYPTSPGGTIYWTSSLTISGSNTIAEAGIFLEMSSNEYMFARITFSGQAQSSGIPFGMTLRIED